MMAFAICVDGPLIGQMVRIDQRKSKHLLGVGVYYEHRLVAHRYWPFVRPALFLVHDPEYMPKADLLDKLVEAEFWCMDAPPWSFDRLLEWLDARHWLVNECDDRKAESWVFLTEYKEWRTRNVES